MTAGELRDRMTVRELMQWDEWLNHSPEPPAGTPTSRPA